MSRRFTVDDVDAMYGGRSSPAGQARPITRSPAMETASERNMAHNRHDNQDSSEFHANNYDNDCSGWLRGSASGEPTGYDETAENKPRFDHSPPRSKMRR